MRSNLVPALRIFLGLTVLTGVAYPLAVTGIAQIAFKREASGSLIEQNGKILGSSLIAQKFETDRYFKSRPSAGDYNPLPSGGTNLGPTAKKLRESFDQQKAKYGNEAVPQDLLFASGSGLDPHLSPQAVRFQIAKVSQGRAFSAEQTKRLEAMVESKIESRQLGFLGEERINVLELNLELDRM